MKDAAENTAVDPAGGTGDLLLYYGGVKHIWDIDESALKLCEFNYELNKQTNYQLSCKKLAGEGTGMCCDESVWVKHRYY
jgi:hypothetical protein